MVNTIEKKPWYKSKTKIGSVVFGASVILGGVGTYLTGAVEIPELITTLTSGVGIVLFGLGLRDALPTK